MRSLAFFLILFAVPSCSDTGENSARIFIEDFENRSSVLHCTPTYIGGFPGTVSRLEVRDETSLFALDGLNRNLFVVDSTFSDPVAIALNREGPGALLEPRDVMVASDQTILVADRLGRRLQRLSYTGEPLDVIPLPFSPESIARAGEAVVISSLRLGPDAPLLHVYRHGEVEPLDIPPVVTGDWRMDAIANLVETVGYADGYVFIAHQFVTPTAYLIDLDGLSEIRSIPIPLPDDIRDDIGWLPTPPFEESELRRVVTPVLDATLDIESRDFLYLTRTGRMTNGYHEKALIRVDREMAYLASYRLPMNAGHFAYLSSKAEAVVVDELDRWFRCPIER